jgi:hypothetical protein
MHIPCHTMHYMGFYSGFTRPQEGHHLIPQLLRRQTFLTLLQLRVEEVIQQRHLP